MKPQIFPVVRPPMSRSKAGWRSSGSAGVPPAVFRVPRNTPGSRKKFVRKLTSECDAGCVARQAGRPRYPEHVVVFFDGHFLR